MSQKKSKNSWWMRIWMFIKFVLVLTLILGLSYFAAFKTEWFILQEFEITCNNENTKILFDSFDKHFKNENIFLISMSEAMEELKTNPYVETIKIKRKFPNKISYVALLREEKVGFLYNDLVLFLDRNGVLLRIGEERDINYVLEGFLVKSFVVGRKLELTNMKELENSLKLVNLLEQTEFEIKPKVFYTDGSIMLRLNDKLKGNFGNGEEIENRYNKFMDIYKDLSSKGINSGVIDVSNKGYPVYKPFGE